MVSGLCGAEERIRAVAVSDDTDTYVALSSPAAAARAIPPRLVLPPETLLPAPVAIARVVR